MVQDLVNQVNEAHMSAAHFKLQHHLLTLESQESAQRAEIEHQMTRREVEFLQASDRRRSFQSSTSRIPPSPSQSQMDALLKSSKALEAEKNEDKRRLRKAKRIIEIEMGKSEALLEENSMLKQRIQENRKHFNLYLQSSANTPRIDFSTPQRRISRQLPASERSRVDDRGQDPLAALLAADQVLNGEAASHPSTPTKIRISKSRPGHSRGAYSLSSLQTTPGHLTAEEISMPASSSQVSRKNGEKHRRDRDSTISVSDDEALTDDELPQSQASSLAASMLRRIPGSQESSAHSAKAEKSSKALQTKLFGQVKKSGVESKKRRASFGESEKAKKAKLGEGVGLGIGSWGRSVVR